jgi:hypothetical protein
MNLGASVRIAMRALASNPLRSLLTMLGVIIGVGAVVAMGRLARARQNGNRWRWEVTHGARRPCSGPRGDQVVNLTTEDGAIRPRCPAIGEPRPGPDRSKSSSN